MADVIFPTGITDGTPVSDDRLLFSDTSAANATKDCAISALPVSDATQTAIDAKVSDTVYGPGWNGVTTIAPSKNAVYDVVNSIVGTPSYPYITVGYSVADYIVDGTADDVQINAAIASLGVTGGTVYVKDGTYSITARIDVDANVHLILSSGAVLKRETGYVGDQNDVVRLAGAFAKLTGGTVDGNSIANAVTANHEWDVKVTANNCIVNGVYVKNTGDGIDASIGVIGTVGTPIKYVKIINCHSERDSDGHVFQYQYTENGTTTNCSSYGGVGGTTQDGFRTYDTTKMTFNGCVSEKCRVGFQSWDNGNRYNSYIGCRAEGNYQHGFLLDGIGSGLFGCISRANLGFGLKVSQDECVISGFLSTNNAASSSYCVTDGVTDSDIYITGDYCQISGIAGEMAAITYAMRIDGDYNSVHGISLYRSGIKKILVNTGATGNILYGLLTKTLNVVDNGTGTVYYGADANITGALTASNFSGSSSGTNTGDNAANSSTTYIGTTAVALNRASAALALTGVTSIDGSSASTTGNAATVTTNANLTGPITSTGNATAIASQTGTGTTFVMSAAPTITGKIGLGGAAGAARVDIWGGGNGTGGVVDALFGGDNNIDISGATVPARTDATNKAARFGFPGYTIANRPSGLIIGTATSTNNTVAFGGGSSAVNAATILSFYSAAGVNTATGTEVMRIDASQNVNIYTATASTSTTTGALVVTGGAGISGALFTGSLSTAGIITSTNTTVSTLSTDGAIVSTGSISASVSSTVTSGNQYAAYKLMTSNPAGASSAGYYGSRAESVVSDSCAQNITGVVAGFIVNATHSGSGNVTTFRSITSTLTASVGGGTNAFNASLTTTLAGSSTVSWTAVRSISAPTTFNNANLTITTFNALDLTSTLTAAAAITNYRAINIGAANLTGVGTSTLVVGIDMGAINAASTSPATTAYAIRTGNVTGAVTNYQLNLGTGISVFADTTASTSTTTGAVVVAGGVGIGESINFSGNFTDDGQAARTWSLARNTTAATAGVTLTIHPGGATSGSTNKTSGPLILSGGTSTGTGTSSVQIYTTPVGSSGAVDNTPAATFGFFRLSSANNAVMTIGDVSGTGAVNGINFSGLVAYNILHRRHTTANTAGTNLTINASGATSGATDKNGGTLILTSGISTGTGVSGISFKTSPAGSTGTSDNTLTEQFSITGNGNVISGNQAALATTATDGFLYVPTCAGTPTGVPTAYTGKCAIVVDTTNHKLYVYDGSWLAMN